jgi:hypothetical protein
MNRPKARHRTAPTDCRRPSIHQQERRKDLTSPSAAAHHANAPIVQSKYNMEQNTILLKPLAGMYFSFLLGTIFYKLNYHHWVKSFDAYKYVNMFNFLQASSSKYHFLDYGAVGYILFVVGSSQSILSDSCWSILIYKSYVSYSGFSIIHQFPILERENTVYVNSTLSWLYHYWPTTWNTVQIHLCRAM